jgi:magnesium chelatase family protein
MRGRRNPQMTMLAFIDLEERVPVNHPLRMIKRLADEALEVTRIRSVAGRLREKGPVVRRRPFLAPHHTISPAGLVGGGVGRARPGELSLAHRGVLFLDELPEFGHQVLDVMRQPLEDGVVSLGRARGTVSFPAKFMLIGAMNPCPCM